MKKKVNYNKIPRRLLTATMSCVFIISLSSCSGAKNNYGNLDVDSIYATSGNYSVTNGDLWNELKWSASSKLNEQIENVILNEQINKITLVMNNIGKYDSLSNDDKKLFNDSKEEFDNLATYYQKRLVDYVVQDIYDLTYSNDSYWDDVEDLEATEKKILQAKYVDSLLSTYQIEKIGNDTVKDLVNNATQENSNYLTIATNVASLYYPSFAKELLAYDKLSDEIKEGNEADTDPEDTMLGYFSKSDYISKFKSEFGNQQDLNLILIRFKTEDEFNDTLRAFGVKLYNKQYYYLPSETEGQTYKEYCDYYDDYSSIDLSANMRISDKHLLEIFIQMYNYLYGGYRTTLTSSVSGLPTVSELNNLRQVTQAILETDVETTYENTVKLLNENNAKDTVFTKDELDEINTTLSTYLYETLDLDETMYSVATQNYNDSYYIAYKFGEGENTLYGSIYNKDLTDDEIVEILTNEDNSKYKEQLQDALLKDKLTESAITNYLTEAKEDIKVKIYDEATEISYAKDNSSYSKTLKGSKNKNLLATIEYNDKTWNLNIVADDNDENSILIPGSTNKYGVFNDLEKQYGQTTAIDILSTKIIKDTQAYTDSNKDRDLYVEYVETILYNFANEGYSSSGYPSSLGKYNFLMLYFHSADINDIVNNYYRVQFASVKLLTDYSNDKLINLFKTYTDKNYDNYFSLEGSRLVVSFDGDDDTNYDDVNEWKDNVVNFEGKDVTLQEVAKNLVYEMYKEISASPDSHTTKLESLVSEYNSSARVQYDAENPVPVENQWAKYRKLGLTIAVEDFTATNSSVDIDFNLKQRLYDYVDPNGKYQYFKNDTTPTIYIEPLDEQCTNTDNNTIVETKDGYNLILVTSGSTKPSAELKLDDYDDDLLLNIIVKYNDEYYTIENLANDTDKLNNNQIKLYVLEYVSTQTSSLTPSALSSAYTTFLSPVLTRFTGNETQREIILQYIENASGAVKFTTEGYDDLFAKLSQINKDVADDYIDLYEDPTQTANSFSDWWTNLENYLKETN